MTCEVAVMNARGVALAADSAATLDNGVKCYNTAEKLFQLTPGAPVAIMTYGAAELLGVPWETVIAEYGRQPGPRRFATLDEYWRDFVAFIDGARTIVTAQMQRDGLHAHAFGLWHCLYAEPLAARLKGRKKGRPDRDALLRELIAADHERWLDYAELPDLDADFADRVIAEYGEILDKVERAVFGEAPRSDDIRHALRETIRYFFTTSGCVCVETTGIVLAGFGEAEVFPSLLHHQIGAVVLDRTIAIKIGEARIAPDSKAAIVPFGQRQVIDALIQGIDPALHGKLPELMAAALQPRRKRQPVERQAGTVDDRAMDFYALVQAEIQRSYDDPFMTGVAAMPRHDLTHLAESLVALTALRIRCCAPEKDTVGGPIDVAIVSKGEGFVWMRRKKL